MSDVEDKLACFRAVTGIEDTELCTEILTAHNWDLESAVSAITDVDNGGNNHRSPSPSTTISDDGTEGLIIQPNNGSHPQDPTLASKLIALPFSIVSGGLKLMSSAIGRGMWAAGGAISYSLGLIGINGSNRVTSTSSASEAVRFVTEFEREYGRLGSRPNFLAEGFSDALKRSRCEHKFMFMYLHSPDHQDTEMFYEGTLCDERLVKFLNETFVIWGGNVKASEGFKLSNRFKAPTFPFCMVLMATKNQRVVTVKQIEGRKSPEEMRRILQRALEVTVFTLVSASAEAAARRNNIRLREEQDAAYRAALEADQARELQRKEREERLEREAAEAERKKMAEEEARSRAAWEADIGEAARAMIREEKALSLGDEPEKGPDVTQVLIWFPSGECRERRFHCTTTIQSLYDYVDSLGWLEMNGYSLVSSFPRTVYGQDRLALSLKEAGLHPQAILFIELN